MNILFLSRWFPQPLNNGSKLRIYNLLRGLGKYHSVTLLSFADQQNGTPEAPEIRSLCPSVHVVPWREFNPKSLRARFGFLSLKPRSVVDTFSPQMARKIRHLLAGGDYDLVIASELSMAAYRPYFKKMPALFEDIEIGLSVAEANPSSGLRKHLRYASTWFKLRMYLSQLLGSFDACTVVSEQERRLLTCNFSKYKGRVEIIPNCVQMDEYENQRASLVPSQLIFTGSFRYHANYEAMLWFVRDVFPHVLEQVPDARLLITGDHANRPLPSTPNVTLTGHVDNIKALVASSCVDVAPLLSGGGTRLKILESMALGTPVVSTSKGAEGLGVTSGEHLFVADASRDFADSVVNIINNKDVHDQLSSNGKRFVKENYDWDKVMPRFLNLVENIAS